MSRPEFFKYKKEQEALAPQRDKLILSIVPGLLLDTKSYNGANWADKLATHAIFAADKIILEANK